MLVAPLPDPPQDVSTLAEKYRAYLDTPEGDAEKRALRADVYIARDHLHISEALAREVVKKAYETPILVRCPRTKRRTEDEYMDWLRENDLAKRICHETELTRIGKPKEKSK